MKRFDITYFYGPFPEYVVRPETIADIAKAGFGLMPLHYSTKVNKAALPVLNRYGIRAIVQDPRISEVYAKGAVALADETVKEVVKDYAEFGNIEGWDIVDEPNAAKFPVLAAIVNAFRRYSPEKETVINLFPNYASPEQLGNPDYITHLEEFVNVVRPHLISYDHYHFLGRDKRNEILDIEGIDERERLIRLSAQKTEDRSGFFSNIEAVLSVSRKYGIPPMLIVLLVEHGPYRNLTKDEIFWEVNMCLAYGMKRISYFTYWCPEDDPFWHYENAMCDCTGNKTKHYYEVLDINREIRAVGEHLFYTEPYAVYHIGEPEEGAKAFRACSFIKGIDGDCGVISFFENGSVYLCNRDFKKANTFVIRSERPLSYMKDGVFTELDTDTVTLEAGRAILLRA